MISSKPKLKTVKITDLTVDFDLNVRERNNYDLPSIMDQIKTAGRILKPIIVRGEDMKVLSGNRRTLAGQELVKDPQCPQELYESLQKVDVMIYTNLSPEEELILILDHGGEKQIARSEVLKTVWRLDKQFWSPSKIIGWMFHSLAAYTGNTRKLTELPPPGPARDKELNTWFHGTVGNYMLGAARLNDYVREQCLKTHLAEDKLLPAGESVEMKTSRKRIEALTAAKKADSKNKEWEDGHGPTFDALIEDFKEEDRGNPKPKSGRPTVKELNDKADVFKSAYLKDTIRTCAGDTESGKTLSQADDTLFRLECIEKLFRAYATKVKSPEVRELIVHYLRDPKSDSHGVAVEEFLKSV